MTEFTKGTPLDNEDILDFGNYVFSHDGAPTDFVKLVPKYYKKSNEAPEEHFLVKENGRIKAMVGLFNLEMNVLDVPLRVGGIGTVSVHPYARGSGYMKKLMNSALDEMFETNVDIGILGGQRQRYEYFGFEPAGVSVSFYVNSTNIRHHKSLCIHDVTFKKVDENSADELEFIKALHQKQPVKMKRYENKFYDTLISGDGEVHVVLNGGEICGYVISDKSHRSIFETELTDYSVLPSMLKSFFEVFGVSDISLTAAEFEREKTEVLARLCEGYSLRCDGNYAVFNFKKAVGAFLRVKAMYTDLADGEITFKVNNALNRERKAEIFTVSVKNGEISVCESEAEADVTLDYLDAVRLMFSSASYFESFGVKMPYCVKSWFPLPIKVFRPDDV